MWTATLVSIVPDTNSGNLIARITYTSDDNRTYTPAPLNAFDLSDTIIKNQMARVVNVLNMRDANLAAITLVPGVVDLTDAVVGDPKVKLNGALNIVVQQIEALGILRSAVLSGAILADDPAIIEVNKNLAVAKANLATAQDAVAQAEPKI